MVLIRVRNYKGHLKKTGSNRTFPSSLVPLFQTSLSAKPFTWKRVVHAVSFSCKSVIFTRMFLPLDLLWNRNTRELRNGLLYVAWSNISSLSFKFIKKKFIKKKKIEKIQNRMYHCSQLAIAIRGEQWLDTKYNTLK